MIVWRRVGVSLGLVSCLSFVSPVYLTAQELNDPMDVLFVGNSYIYYNDLPRIVEAISGALGGPDILTEAHTHGGSTLRRHLGDGHLPGVFASGSWDKVILQEQSALGTALAEPSQGKLGDPGNFHQATREVVAMVEELGAGPLLYMTWAKERFPDQTGDLAQAYDKIGAELQVPVAPVGLAWARVREERPDIRLFVKDGSHPNGAGSYLAACVIYAELTGRSPVGAPAEIAGQWWKESDSAGADDSVTLVSLAPEVARYLQQLAWDVSAEHEAR